MPSCLSIDTIIAFQIDPLRVACRIRYIYCQKLELDAGRGEANHLLCIDANQASPFASLDRKHQM